MKRFSTFLACAAMSFACAQADTGQTVTIDGSVVGKFVTGITFDGDNVTLAFDDATTQTADMALVSIDLTYDGSGDTDGISDVTLRTEKPAAIYTLSGQKVSAPMDRLPRGLYIVNGKKVIVK